MALLVTNAVLDEGDLIRRGLVGPEEASVKNPDHGKRSPISISLSLYTHTPPHVSVHVHVCR